MELRWCWVLTNLVTWLRDTGIRWTPNLLVNSAIRTCHIFRKVFQLLLSYIETIKLGLIKCGDLGRKVIINTSQCLFQSKRINLTRRQNLANIKRTIQFHIIRVVIRNHIRFPHIKLIDRCIKLKVYIIVRDLVIRHDTNIFLNSWTIRKLEYLSALIRVWCRSTWF